MASRSAARAIISAELRAGRLYSCTVKITGWCGAAALIWRARSSAFSNSGRCLIRLEIFSEKTVRQRALRSAASWTSRSCPLVEQRAYPIRIGSPGASTASSSTSGPGDQREPGRRSAGTATARSSRSAGTRTNRAVWYFAATLPARVRHTLPAGTSHFGHGFRSTAAAASSGLICIRIPLRKVFSEP